MPKNRSARTVRPIKQFRPTVVDPPRSMSSCGFCHASLRTLSPLARSQASAFNIHVLENDTLTLGNGGVRLVGAVGNSGVRLVGATLWTDYQVFGETNQAAVMNASTGDAAVTSCSAALRLSMSRCTSASPRQVIGPVHTGRWMPPTLTSSVR